MCAAQDVNVSAAISLKNGSLIPSQSLGLPRGLTLIADSDGTWPGIAGGTVNIAPLTPKVTVVNAPVAIYYNPVSYSAQTNYLPQFTLSGGAALAQYMLVFPDGANKSFDGTNIVNFTSLKGAPNGVTLIADPGSSAFFDTASPGLAKSVTFSGYSLGGPNANRYAFATSCCGPATRKTTADITTGSSAPFAVPGFLFPLIAPPFIESSALVSSLASPEPVELFEVLPPVTPQETLTNLPLTPPNIVAPLRRRKQDRS